MFVTSLFTFLLQSRTYGNSKTQPYRNPYRYVIES